MDPRKSYFGGICLALLFLLALPEVQPAAAIDTTPINGIGLDSQKSGTFASGSTVVLTTATSRPNEIVLVCTINNGGVLVSSVTDNSTVAPVWHQRIHYAGSASLFEDLWYAVFPGLSGKIGVTVHYASNIANADALAVFYNINPTNPFSSNVALPATAHSAVGGAPTVVVSTSEFPDLIYDCGARGSASSETAGAGFTLIESNTGNGMAIWTQFQVVPNTQTNLSTAFASGAPTWNIIGDALQQASSVPPTQLYEDGVCSNTLGGAATTVACTLPTTTEPNEILIAMVDVYTSTPGTITVADSICASWTPIFPVGGGTATDAAFYCKSTTPTGSHAVTATIVSNTATITVSAWAGPDFLSPLDANPLIPIVNVGSSTSPSSTINTTSRYSVVFDMTRAGGAPTITHQPGFLVLGTGSSSGKVLTSYSVLTSPLTNFVAGPTLSTSQSWTHISFALEGVYASGRQTSPAIIYTNIDPTATRQTSQEKTIVAKGQFWYITKDSTGLECQTSYNGQQFSSKTPLFDTALGSGASWSSYYDPTTNTLLIGGSIDSQVQVGFAFFSGSLPTSNPSCGNITWVNNATTIKPTGITWGLTSTTVAMDSEGDFLAGFQGCGISTIACNTNSSAKFYNQIWECVATCGTQTNWNIMLNQNTGVTYQLSFGLEVEMGSFGAASGGAIWEIWGRARIASPLVVTTCVVGGCNPSASTIGTYTYSGPNSGRAAGVGMNFYAVAPDSTGGSAGGGNLQMVTCQYPCASLIEEPVITTGDVMFAALSSDHVSKFAIVYAYTNQTTIDYISSSNLGGSWSAPRVLVSTEGVSDMSINSNLHISNGNVSFTYMDAVTSTTLAGVGKWCGANTAQTTGNSVCPVRALYFSPVYLGSPTTTTTESGGGVVGSTYVNSTSTSTTTTCTTTTLGNYMALNGSMVYQTNVTCNGSMAIFNAIFIFGLVFVVVVLALASQGQFGKRSRR